jgi:hypothetical protein
MPARSSALFARKSTFMMSANSHSGRRGSFGCEVIERDEIASRFQPLAGGDEAILGLNRVSRISATVWLGGNKVIRSLNRTWRVQFTKARLLSQSVSIP